MSMTWDDVAELLAFCAVFDKRRGDEHDIQAWLMVAEDHRWTRAAAFRAAREHYGAGADRPRLEPPAITDRIRHIRGRAAESFELPRIPDDVPDHEYPAWLRARRDEHIDAIVDRWAAAGEEPPRALPAPTKGPADLPALVARAPIQVRRAVATGVQQMAHRKVRLDPERRARARAELDAARPRPDDERATS